MDMISGLTNNGIPLATIVSEILEVDFGMVRTSREGTETNYASNYAGIEGKNVILIDDVISSGSTMKEAIKFVREQGGTAVLIMVLINKRGEDELDNVPLRALIRASTIHSYLSLMIAQVSTYGVFMRIPILTSRALWGKRNLLHLPLG